MEMSARSRRGRGGADSTAPRKRAGGLSSLSTGQTLTMAALLVFLVLTLAMPLRTYAEQRAELAEVNENIARMKQRTGELQAEKDRFSDPAYIKEQARVRLGLVEEGETPFRIIDPQLGQAPGEEPVGREGADPKPWYRQLWDSVSVPPEEKAPANPGRDAATSPDRLPTVPGSAPESGPDEVPPAG